MIVAPVSGSFLKFSLKSASTFTWPSGNTSFSHSSFHVSGEWQNMCIPCEFLRSRRPFCGSPPCPPKMMDPGSGESKGARRRASLSCCSSGKRWKKDEAWIALTRPTSGVSEVSVFSGGRGSVGTVVGSGEGAREAGSNASAAMKGTGKVFGVDLKSL